MPLLANDTDGAVTRKRLETWVAKEEKVTIVAATDAATVQTAADLAGAGRVVYTMTPSNRSYPHYANRRIVGCSLHRRSSRELV
jgi:hypothetical protein